MMNGNFIIMFVLMAAHLTRAKIKMSPMRSALTPSKQFMMIVPESLGCKESPSATIRSSLTRSRR